MQITTTARHMELPGEIEQLLRDKLEKLEKFGHKLIAVHAVFTREKYFYGVELTLSLKGGTLVGKTEGQKDLLTGMEQAIAKLKTQLRRLEGKRVQEKRRRVPHRGVRPQ